MKLFQLMATIGILIALIACGEESSSQPGQTVTPADLQTSGESAVKAASEMISEAADDAVPANAACPVTGEAVKKDGLKLTYAGKVVGFCCNDCIAGFKADPAKFTAAIK